MHALWLENQHLEYRDDLPIPVPGEEEALIRVHLAGVCSTDLELVKGYYPFTGVPGHEFVGEVVRASSEPAWVGKRVVGEINIACGECEICKSGFTRHCERRKTLGIHDWNGVFAEYIVLPTINLHVVPDNIPDQAAVFTEPLAAACEILEQVNFASQDRVLLIGAGRLGQLIAQVMQTTGCNLEVLARQPRSRELLEQRGIHTIATGDINGKKYDVVIEATGSPDGFALARQSIRPRGTIVLKSTYKGDMQVNFSSIVVDEVTLLGSRCGPFPVALQLLSLGKVNPIPLITTVYPLQEGVAAFGHAARHAVLKVLIKPG
jgi:2-desacetyl-2-hydroxyethyl bacteriochlorophyllide A dehydrogenase